jgi:hypothetical protein
MQRDHGTLTVNPSKSNIDIIVSEYEYLSLFPSTKERNKQLTRRIIPSGTHGNSIPAERRFPILTKDDGLGSRWDDEHL